MYQCEERLFHNLLENSLHEFVGSGSRSLWRHTSPTKESMPHQPFAHRAGLSSMGFVPSGLGSTGLTTSWTGHNLAGSVGPAHVAASISPHGWSPKAALVKPSPMEPAAGLQGVCYRASIPDPSVWNLAHHLSHTLCVLARFWMTQCASHHFRQGMGNRARHRSTRSSRHSAPCPRTLFRASSTHLQPHELTRLSACRQCSPSMHQASLSLGPSMTPGRSTPVSSTFLATRTRHSWTGVAWHVRMSRIHAEHHLQGSHIHMHIHMHMHMHMQMHSHMHSHMRSSRLVFSASARSKFSTVVRQPWEDKEAMRSSCLLSPDHHAQKFYFDQTHASMPLIPVSRVR